MSRMLFSLLLLAILGVPAGAHYNMLLPATPRAKKDDNVTFTHQWGHPFEHELSDVPAIRELYVIAPDGKRTDLRKLIAVVKVPGVDGKQVTAHRFTFTPERRGDHTFVLATEPMFLQDMEESVQDVVRVVLHVQTQNGWDVATGDAAELLPLTRPYGLLPGMVFQARALGPPIGKQGMPREPLAGAAVEWERYNAVPLKQMPEDELITFRAKTDPNGVLTCTLPDPGWWAITVLRPAGTAEVQGKAYPLKQRLTHWVHVSERK